jgi:hypothetical protein
MFGTEKKALCQYLPRQAAKEFAAAQMKAKQEEERVRSQCCIFLSGQMIILFEQSFYF